jgi:hypothetical protein
VEEADHGADRGLEHKPHEAGPEQNHPDCRRRPHNGVIDELELVADHACAKVEDKQAAGQDVEVADDRISFHQAPIEFGEIARALN